ncbi:MAG: transpeptidase family protein [Chitinophagales bacterium]|nr:transpeptidase family protein [Chitinophagales bacterium]MDW8428745.1 penicillin-binding protein [Chitinophagales bacterium]
MTQALNHQWTWRAALIYVLLALGAIAIGGRLIYLQQVEGPEYLALLDSVITRYVTVPAQRGNIYSADGRLLATTVPVFEIRMDLKADGLTSAVFQSGVDSLSRLLAQLFQDRSAAAYRKLLIQARQRGERYLLIKKNVTYSQLQQLRTFPIFRLGQYKGGLIVVTQHKRMYPYRRLAQRTIGYVRDASVQPVGLEAQYHEFLKGQPGKRLVKKVGGGQVLPITDKNEIDPVNGQDVVITINVTLQDIAESALERALAAHQAHHGCVVLMETRSGAIRAMVNLSRQADGTYVEDYNYAIAESQEPGSTFKLASLLVLLEDGYVRLHDSVDLNYGTHVFGSQIMRDAEAHDHRKVDVLKAFALSSNVGISKLIAQYYRHQPERFIAHLRRIGLDKPTGIDLPGEPWPFIKSAADRSFSQYSLPWMSVGYELKLTPLQLLCFYNAIANDGRWVQPHLLERTESFGQVKKQHQTLVMPTPICKEATLRALRASLEAVVEAGTAKNIKHSSYKIAGKTGTALLADAYGGYDERRYVASFVGYFPADDPQYTMIVMIHQPSAGRYYGSQVAAPVFREIADRIYAAELFFRQPAPVDSVKTPVQLPLVVKAHAGDVGKVLSALNVPVMPSSTDVWVSIDPEQGIKPSGSESEANKVPDVRGLGLRNAIYVLESAGYRVQASGLGIVVQQQPPPATSWRAGQVVNLELQLQP